MIKNVFTFLLLLLLLFSFIQTTISPSSAGFFKKLKFSGTKSHKTDKNVGETAKKEVSLAVIYASWCPGCKNIQPTLDQIEKEFKDKINLIYFDVSTPKKALESAKKAKELKLADFYNSYKSKTSTVAVVVPKSSEVVTIFQNNNSVDSYKAAIEAALIKAKALENPPA